MELDTTVQVTLNEVSNQVFDLLIVSSGYETRSVFLSQRIPTTQIKRKVALAFLERKDCISRSFNDRTFEQSGFEMVDASMNSIKEIHKILGEFCSGYKNKEINILVDYSSMPKLWYEAIINYFSENDFNFDNLKLWFSYTPSEYAESLHDISNKYFELDIPARLSTKPKALVIGLGYEKGRAQELAHRLDAQVTYSFYSDPAVDPRFVKELIENNMDILKKLDSKKIIKYPIYDLNYINSSLTHLCVDLRLTHQIVLAPIGPKPFTLMCFLLNARYPDLKIWRFSSVAPKEVYDRKPHGELLVYKVHFTCDNTEYDD